MQTVVCMLVIWSGKNVLFKKVLEIVDFQIPANTQESLISGTPKIASDFLVFLISAAFLI
jgi:hypothetical protein|tara:strand:- start:934 stop:1113 length:180 start_codon:yes stop_codon:yes gene_type:complete